MNEFNVTTNRANNRRLTIYLNNDEIMCCATKKRCHTEPKRVSIFETKCFRTTLFFQCGLRLGNLKFILTSTVTHEYLFILFALTYKAIYRKDSEL
jgi:hypothetical protein